MGAIIMDNVKIIIIAIIIALYASGCNITMHAKLNDKECEQSLKMDVEPLKDIVK